MNTGSDYTDFMPDAAIEELMAKMQKQFCHASRLNTVAVVVVAGADNVVSIASTPDVHCMPAAGGQGELDAL